MEISSGFLIILILVLFPGLIFRRLYYYGEFSKQFGGGLSVIKLISISSIPGIINLTCIFFFYEHFISPIDIGEVVDILKDISNPVFKQQELKGISINDIFRDKIIPFLGFLYFSVILIGILSGRLVRITRIDTKFKLLRFKNHWFYLFNGEHIKFKKMRHLKEPNSKHLFTIADILIDSNSKTLLYSGVVVDYELKDDDCQSLHNVVLQNAERYSFREDKRVAVKIPGNLLIVDCSEMKNINLTFVNEQHTDEFLETKAPAIINLIFSFAIILFIPFFIFQTDIIKWSPYIYYFKLPWYEKIIIYLLFVQILSLLNPFVKNKIKEEYELISWKMIVAKLFWIIVLILISRFI